MALTARSLHAQFALSRAYALKPSEGVYAYARISPDGTRLVYASELLGTREYGAKSQVINVVDLATQRVSFREPGIDAYWAPDGQRLIYKSFVGRTPHVDVRNLATNTVVRDVLPVALGDYFSWGTRNGRDVILTITGNYGMFDGRSVITPRQVPSCGRYGAAERPLISKDGSRITTFSRGMIVVRELSTCNNIVDTEMEGAKADFSWDGGLIAFHAPKVDGSGYGIRIVDIRNRTVREIDLPGSSLFPSWTRDGRLCFRYDGPDYRGFVMASKVLELRARPIKNSRKLSSDRTWQALFPGEPRPPHRINLVVVWATWSAHSMGALTAAASFRDSAAQSGWDIGIAMATEVSSRTADIRPFLSRRVRSLRRIALPDSALIRTAAANQIPTTLLFRDDILIGEHLGAQSAEELRTWMAEVGRR